MSDPKEAADTSISKKTVAYQCSFFDIDVIETLAGM